MNDDLDQLDKKISAAKQTGEEPKSEPSSDKNDSMQTASEFLSYVIAGIVLGFLADKYIGTAPWGIIILPVLGLVAGVCRANQAMNRKP